MERRYIKITEYCEFEKIETQFVLDLHNEGIIELSNQNNENLIDEEILPDLEMFSRWHYDLGVNLEGIDAMRHMLNRMKTLQQEILELKMKLGIYP